MNTQQSAEQRFVRTAEVFLSSPDICVVCGQSVGETAPYPVTYPVKGSAHAHCVHWDKELWPWTFDIEMRLLQRISRRISRVRQDVDNRADWLKGAQNGWHTEAGEAVQRWDQDLTYLRHELSDLADLFAQL